MKRKALITATAVLLVAVMCLATASYAWFTSGNTAKINQFELTVSTGDGSIMIAPAQPAAGGFVNKGYANVRDLTDWNNIGILPSDNNTLTACSTTGTLATGATTPVFMGTSYESGTWTADEDVANSYLLISFYAYSPADTVADLTVDFTAADANSNLDIFKSAVKVGLDVVDVAEGVTATKDTPLVGKGFDIYTLDGKKDWKALVTNGATVTRDTDGRFTGEGTTEVTINSGELKLADQNFAKNTPKLYTLAIWLEGQDSDCYLDYNCGNIKCDVVFTEQTTNA